MPDERGNDFEDLLADCIEAFEDGGAPALGALLARQPDRAGDVHAVLEQLQQNGMLGDLRPAGLAERIGEFHILGHLGSGGMGSVWLARQESLDRLVAVKLIHPALAASDSVVQRFRREAQAIARLDHPNIVRVIASGSDGGQLFLAMELVPGESLDELLAREPRPPVRRVVEWGRDIARALGCAHRAGLVHRDVKPSNVRITPDGRAMLLDFGLARDAAAGSDALTRTGSFHGSPNYASPEQVVDGAAAVDARTDVYSLGITLLQALTGELPFAADTEARVFQRIQHDPVPRPRRLNPEVSRDLETVVLAATARDRRHRYPDADALADDLDRLLTLRPVRARPAPLLHRARLMVRRHRALAATALLVLVASIAGVVATWNESRLTAREAARGRAVNEFLLEILAWSDPDQYGGGEDLTVREALQRAADQVLERFAGEPDLEASVRLVAGNALRGLNRLQEAERHLTRALQLRLDLFGDGHCDVVEVQEALAMVHSVAGDHAAALPLRRAALAAYRDGLGDDPLLLPTAMLNLASTLGALDHDAESERLLAECEPLFARLGKPGLGRAATALTHYARLMRKRGDRKGEVQALRRALARYEESGYAEHPYTALTRHSLAMALFASGRTKAALAEGEQACATLAATYGEDDERTAKARATVARMRELRGGSGERTAQDHD